MAQKIQPIISIIGDQGLIGSWMKDLLIKHNYTVLGTDIENRHNTPECVKKSDIILLAVPLLKTLDAIGQIRDVLRPDQLLVDFTSIKNKISRSFPQLNCKLLSLHPMFAPFGNDFKNEKVIVCDVKNHAEYTELILGILKGSGLDLISSNVDEHDRMMGLVQGVTHFLSLSLLLTIKKAGIDADKTFDFSSPIYRMRLASACRIVMQDPGLYHGIFVENEYLPAILSSLEESINELKQIIEKKDLQATSDLFLSLRSALGPQAKKSLKHTERLIEFMRQLED